MEVYPAKGEQPGYLASIALIESLSVCLALRALLIVPKASKYVILNHGWL